MAEEQATLVLVEDDGTESLVDREQLRTTIAAVLEKMIHFDAAGEFPASRELYRIRQSTSAAYARLVARELVAIIGPWMLEHADELLMPRILAQLNHFILGARRLTDVGGSR